MSSLPVRLGVIGLSVSGGWAANVLVKPLLPPSPLASAYKITAICTTSHESAIATSEKYSLLLGYAVKAYHGPSGAQDIADDPEVDMVVVAVKVTDHKRSVLPALHAGKRVFVEWPLGRNVEEAKEISEVAQSMGIQGVIGDQVLQSPALRKVCLILGISARGES